MCNNLFRIEVVRQKERGCIISLFRNDSNIILRGFVAKNGY